MELRFHDYCKGCMDVKAKQTTMVGSVREIVVSRKIIVTCEHYNLCERLMERMLTSESAERTETQ